MNNEKSTVVATKNSFEAILTIPNTEAIGKLGSAEAGMNMTVKYRQQEDWPALKNQPIRCFFLGLKEIPNDKDEKIPCGVFMDKTGVWLAGQMVLVDAVRNLNTGTAIEITFLGKKPNKVSDGSTNLFDVRLLNNAPQIA